MSERGENAHVGRHSFLSKRFLLKQPSCSEVCMCLSDCSFHSFICIQYERKRTINNSDDGLIGILKINITVPAYVKE